MSNVYTPDQGAASGSPHQFLNEGMAAYFDVVKALHLLQTQVADVLMKTVDTSREKIATVMKLAQTPGETNRHVYPDFPMDEWDYEVCDIHVRLWLADPQRLSLYLGVDFKTSVEGMQACTLYCAVEVYQQYRRNEWLRVFQGHQELLDEVWHGHVIGLRRPLTSPEHLEEESAQLLDDFLECLRKVSADNS